ncbi:uncharacterized protein [Garra rufa]|uniref:uncharacterized protein n=1 Tax=Garra rufa TaxID=137080 RepID=UPI003CCED12E
MDLGFFTDKMLFDFFRQNKTKISTIENPLMFLRLLKDNNLITKEHFQKLENNADDDSLYHMLEFIETSGKKKVRKFWQCVVQDHILQRYLQLSEITKTLKNVLPKPKESNKIRKSSEDCNTEGKREVKRMRTESSSLNNQAGSSSKSTNSQIKTSEHVLRVSPAPQNNYLGNNNTTTVKSTEQDVGKERESNSVNNQAGPSSQIPNSQKKTSEDVDKAPVTKVKPNEQDVGKEQEVKKTRTESSSVNNQTDLSLQSHYSQLKIHVERVSPASQNNYSKNNKTTVKSTEQDVGKERESNSVNNQTDLSLQSHYSQLKIHVERAHQNHSVRKNNETKVRSKEQDVGKELEVKKMRVESSSVNNQAGPSSQITNSQKTTSENVEKDSPAPQNHSVRTNSQTKVNSNEQDVGKVQEVKKMRTESSSVNNQTDPSSQITKSQLKIHVERVSPASQNNYSKNNKTTVKSTKQYVGKERESNSVNNQAGPSSQITNNQKTTSEDVEKDSPAPQNHSVRKNSKTIVKSKGKSRTESSSVNNQTDPSSQITNSQLKTSEHVEKAPQNNSLGKNNKTKVKSTEQDVGKEAKKTESNSVNNQAGPSSQITNNQKKTSERVEKTSPVEKEDKQIWTRPIYKTQLPINCGNKEGTLFREKLTKGEECILFHGHWFTPTGFEKFAGKEKVKNWKFSIRCGSTPLKKLIEEGHLQCPLMNKRKRKCVQKNMNKQFPLTSNRRSSKDSKTSSGSMEESDGEDFQEQGGKGGGTEFRGRVEEEEEEEEDMADLSVFKASSLPVTCVSLTGTLYKYRFASGSRGKCIRTEERWFTPEEFVKQESTLTDGHWKKDILCHGKTLKFLLQKDILCIHLSQCECEKCCIPEKDSMAQNNDDECYVCRSEGDLLVCCDECPRAFHSHCHLPAADGDSPGEWICTFCTLRNSQNRHDSTNMSEQEAFNAPVAQYILHCHYLLLCVYREDIQKLFFKDPHKTVRRYSEFITQPMWLDKIKQKLESGAYQTVGAFISDLQLIFSNCSTFNGDNRFGRIGARLKQMFEKEFQRIFSIQ